MNLTKGIKILIGPSSFAELDRTPINRLEEAGFAIVNNPYGRKLTKEELLRLLAPDVKGIIAGLETLDKTVFTQTRLKVISRVGSGLSNVDLNAAKEQGIKVFSTPDGPTEAVAELTLGVMLDLSRMISQMNQDLHDGKWRKKIGIQLMGKTIAIIGFGRIGRRVAELLAPFHVRILVVDPLLKDRDVSFSQASLAEAITQADIITVHANCEGCIIGREEISRMKSGVLLLNPGRGWLIDETALFEFIEQGKIGGAWLDVFMEEPYNGPLKNYPQVLMTPHVGSYTLECRKQMECEAVENLIKGFFESEG